MQRRLMSLHGLNPDHEITGGWLEINQWLVHLNAFSIYFTLSVYFELICIVN